MTINHPSILEGFFGRLKILYIIEVKKIELL
jgi:hypothetical protein